MRSFRARAVIGIVGAGLLLADVCPGETPNSAPKLAAQATADISPVELLEAWCRGSGSLTPRARRGS